MNHERINSNQFVRIGLSLIGVFFLLQIVFLLCNICSAAIPKEPILEHLNESKDSPLLSRVFEYDHDFLGSHICYDNNRFIEAMANQNDYNGDLIKEALLCDIEFVMPDWTSEVVYFRYWHGWQLLAFICLYFGPIELFAFVVAIIVFASTLFFLNELRKYIGWAPAIVFCITSFISTNIIGNFVGDLLLAYSVFIVICCCGFILRAGRNPSRANFTIPLITLITGCLFCYLDFLTIPAFAIAITVFSCLIASNALESKAKTGFLLFCKYSAIFLIAFIGTWLAKWLLAGFYLGFGEVFSGVFSEISLWTADSSSTEYDNALYTISPRLYSLVASLARVFTKTGGPVWNYAGVLFCVSTLILSCLAIRKIILAKKKAGVKPNSGILPVLATSLFPPCFAIIAYAHTLWHLGIFGYKPWGFTLGCISAIALYLIINKRAFVPNQKDATRAMSSNINEQTNK